MSRLRKFAHSLVSGYVLLGANVLYSLASVPLALGYLSKAEFGLWALVTSIAGYIALVDLGMSGSVARILIDYKDHPEREDYGSALKTSALVGVVQGSMVLVIGVLLAFLLGPLLRVPEELRTEFTWLMVAQSAVQALSFPARVFSQMLNAHQRYDVTNHAQTGIFVVSFFVLWACFALGCGVFSVLWASTIATASGIFFQWRACVRLRLFPRPNCWGQATWSRFRELFAFGWDVFLYSVGLQVVAASQTLLVTRVLGLEQAALWSVGTRAFFLLSQLIFRIFDYSYAALAEMLVRGERALLEARFRLIYGLCIALVVLAASLFAACNQPFLNIWTHGRLGWPQGWDMVLAVSLIVTVCVRLHIGLVGVAKDFRFLRYLFLCEGALFVGLSSLVLKRLDILGMIGASVVAALCFSLPYGVWRSARFFELRVREVLMAWNWPALRVAGLLLPAIVLACWLTRDLPPQGQFILRGSGLTIFGAFVLLRFGLEPSLKAQLAGLMPARLGFVRRILLKPK